MAIYTVIANLQLAVTIAMFTFMIIMYIDGILIDHSHDNWKEVNFTNNPKLSDHKQGKDN